MKKEELIKENQRLADKVSSLYNENDRLRKEVENLEYELDENKKLVQELDRDVYFLAWILYKEWVSIRRFWNRLKIEVIEKSEWTITVEWNDNKRSYHNA